MDEATTKENEMQKAITGVRGTQQKATTTEDGFVTTTIVTEGSPGHHEIIQVENDDRLYAKILGFNDDTLFSVSCFGCSRRYKSLKGARKQAKKMLTA